MTLTTELSKVDLRRLFREKRQLLPIRDRKINSEKAAQHFVQHPLFQNSQHIACYLPLAEEMDTAPLIQAIWEHQKTCYVPRQNPNTLVSITLVPYTHKSTTRRNAWGVEEPVHTFPAHRQPMEVIVLPLVAVDAQGWRLGMGIGCYDRFLAYRNDRPALIGLGYSFQKTDPLPKDVWDIPIHGLLSEKGLEWFRDRET